MAKLNALAILFVLVTSSSFLSKSGVTAVKNELNVGVAAVAITPYGKNPDWDGTITGYGVWGEKCSDTNKNGRWDRGEPFEDDEGNTALDPGSKGKYDGIFLAGFGHDRLATGKYDDYWARAVVMESGATKIAIV